MGSFPVLVYIRKRNFARDENMRYLSVFSNDLAVIILLLNERSTKGNLMSLDLCTTSKL